MRQSIFGLLWYMGWLAAFAWQGKPWPWIASMAFLAGVYGVTMVVKIAREKRWSS